VTLPKPLTSGAKSEGRFGKQDFAYLPEEDVYRCPAGERLPYRYTNEEAGKVRLDVNPQAMRQRRETATALLDNGMSRLPAQIPLHDRAGAADHALGA
jgi:hypothetical protein